jgi:hypothetical protein
MLMICHEISLRSNIVYMTAILRRTITSRRRCRGRRRSSAGVAGAAPGDAQTLAGRFGRRTRRVPHQSIHEHEFAHFIFERRSQSLAGLRIIKHGVKNKTGPWLQCSRANSGAISIRLGANGLREEKARQRYPNDYFLHNRRLRYKHYARDREVSNTLQ